ncbi:hypothetical protein M8J75_004940 [Diaphorina citri]|nr:hypothetical protein M8J75_004940 [Diaphorina citri]KAI5728630.1 hypothetical protein M8J77_018792 [Diaphorina citri]
MFKKAPLESCCGLLPLRLASLIFGFLQLVITLALLLIMSTLLFADAQEISRRLEDDLTEVAEREGISLQHADMREIAIDAGTRSSNILKMHTGRQIFQVVIEILYAVTLCLLFLVITIMMMLYGLITRKVQFIVPWMYAELIIIIIIPSIITVCCMINRYQQNALGITYVIPICVHVFCVFTWIVVYSYYTKLRHCLSSYNTYHKTEHSDVTSNTSNKTLIQIFDI